MGFRVLLGLYSPYFSPPSLGITTLAPPRGRCQQLPRGVWGGAQPSPQLQGALLRAAAPEEMEMKADRAGNFTFPLPETAGDSGAAASRRKGGGEITPSPEGWELSGGSGEHPPEPPHHPRPGLSA